VVQQELLQHRKEAQAWWRVVYGLPVLALHATAEGIGKQR
jgi:hypothetical protein